MSCVCKYSKHKMEVVWNSFHRFNYSFLLNFCLTRNYPAVKGMVTCAGHVLLVYSVYSWLSTLLNSCVLCKLGTGAISYSRAMLAVLQSFVYSQVGKLIHYMIWLSKYGKEKRNRQKSFGIFEFHSIFINSKIRTQW